MGKVSWAPSKKEKEKKDQQMLGSNFIEMSKEFKYGPISIKMSLQSGLMDFHAKQTKSLPIQAAKLVQKEA
jgi:hypothetical protein